MGLKWVKKPKKKIEYSKRIVAIVLSFCIVVTIFSMALMWVTKDTSPLAYLIPSVFAETGIVISFYLDKAKKENIAKGGKKHESELETEVNI
ncbi:hypothetical protein QTL86_03555 [Cellulosilyticum sp. ST5]|uniref:hypothetical protein n=1 Tax=Cellulosilyticum sp. ST5 TaxID=3055805 RepID=UPI003977B412